MDLRDTLDRFNLRRIAAGAFPKNCYTHLAYDYGTSISQPSARCDCCLHASAGVVPAPLSVFFKPAQLLLSRVFFGQSASGAMAPAPALHIVRCWKSAGRVRPARPHPISSRPTSPLSALRRANQTPNRIYRPSKPSPSSSVLPIERQRKAVHRARSKAESSRVPASFCRASYLLCLAYFF